MPLRYVPGTHIKKRLLAFIDLEFSGLEADNEILQIGVVLVRQPSFEIVGEWQTKVLPTAIENADKKSLKLIGYTPAKWKGALPLREALEQFDAHVNGAVLIGYNVVGDFFQLKKSYHQVGLVPSYHWQVLDVMSMSFATLYRTGLDGYRMREVAPYFRIKGKRAWHDALVDARDTFEIFKKVMHRIHND
jgi:DNA polymerase III alpha subunit (gram-positive type)